MAEVPSIPVATVARGTIARLLPVMSWISTSVQPSVESMVQRAWMESPTATTVEPSGEVGVMMARARGRARRGRVRAVASLMAV